jgi:hypothetical protein
MKPSIPEERGRVEEVRGGSEELDVAGAPDGHGDAERSFGS